MISLILFSITLLVLFLNLIRELFVLRDIKSTFYCNHCNTFNNEISNKYICKSCKRKIQIKGNTWDHLIIHRVNWIPTKSKNEVFKWNDYKKLSIIEIAVTLIAIFIVIIAIIFIIVI